MAGALDCAVDFAAPGRGLAHLDGDIARDGIALASNQSIMPWQRPTRSAIAVWRQAENAARARDTTASISPAEIAGMRKASAPVYGLVTMISAVLMGVLNGVEGSDGAGRAGRRGPGVARTASAAGGALRRVYVRGGLALKLDVTSGRKHRRDDYSSKTYDPASP